LTDLKATQESYKSLDKNADRSKAHQLFQIWGNNSIAYITLNPQNKFFFESKGEAYLAYRSSLGMEVTMGDPVGSPEAVRRCISQFIRHCQRRGRWPLFFLAEQHPELYRQIGFKGLQVAEDAHLNLEQLEFKGKNWQDVRTALNRAKREGLEMHQFTSQQASPALIAQFKAISGEWLQSKKLPQMGFTLGALSTIADPLVRTYYALDKQEKVHGFLSWWPCSQAKGWSLDMMRRRQDAMAGTMEFLIAASANRFQSEGYTNLTLGAAPLAPVQRERSLSSTERLIHKLKPQLDYFYNFSSLYDFKRKFQPEWKPLYMFYPPGPGLAASSLAVMRLYFGR
jgi:phosphatidylglycerol lysyltransferase